MMLQDFYSFESKDLYESIHDKEESSEKNEIDKFISSLNDVFLENYEITLKKVESTNDNKEKSFHYMCNALYLLNIGVNREAIESLKKSFELNSSNGTSIILLAIAYLYIDDLKNFELVIQSTFNGFVEKKYTLPKRVLSILYRLSYDHNYREHIYTFKDNFGELVNILYDTETTYIDSDLKIANRELEMGNYEIAINYFTLLLENHPDDIKAIQGRGISYFYDNQWENCIKDLDRSFQGPVDSKIYFYCAKAHSFLGNNYMALNRISTAIDIDPLEFEYYVQRSQIHMSCGNFAHAIVDLRMIPLNYYTSRLFLYLAECNYTTGNIPGACEYLNRIDSEYDHRYYYCSFLVMRDRNRFENAIGSIKMAIELKKSFFLVKTAADFLLELGNVQDASEYYGKAIEMNVNDIETKRLYALTLFMSGREVTGFNQMKELYDMYRETFPLADCRINREAHDIEVSPLASLKKSKSFGDIITEIKCNLMFMYSYIENFESDFLTVDVVNVISRSTLVKLDKMNGKIERDVVHRKISESIKSVIDDATTLGKKVFPKAPEVVENTRVLRSFGLCVLFLAHTIKLKTQESFFHVFNDLIKIIQIADLQKEVYYFENESTIGLEKLPIYVIQDGLRKSPRFENYLADSLSVYHKILQESGNIGEGMLSFLNPINIETMYNIYSKDHCTFSPDTTSLTPPPVFTLKSVGTKGFFFTVSPFREDPTQKYNSENHTSKLAKYDHITEKIELHWKRLVCEEVRDLTDLIMLLFYFWILHPYSEYNNELGHILLHGYALSQGLDIGRFHMRLGDPFMKILISCDAEHLDEVRILFGRSTTTTINQSSINFWNNEISIGTIIDILLYSE